MKAVQSYGPYAVHTVTLIVGTPGGLDNAGHQLAWQHASRVNSYTTTHGQARESRQHRYDICCI